MELKSFVITPHVTCSQHDFMSGRVYRPLFSALCHDYRDRHSFLCTCSVPGILQPILSERFSCPLDPFAVLVLRSTCQAAPVTNVKRDFWEWIVDCINQHVCHDQLSGRIEGKALKQHCNSSCCYILRMLTYFVSRIVYYYKY